MLYIFVFYDNVLECDRLFSNVSALYLNWYKRYEDLIEKENKEVANMKKSVKEKIVVKSKNEALCLIFIFCVCQNLIDNGIYFVSKIIFNTKSGIVQNIVNRKIHNVTSFEFVIHDHIKAKFLFHL